MSVALSETVIAPDEDSRSAPGSALTFETAAAAQAGLGTPFKPQKKMARRKGKKKKKRGV